MSIENEQTAENSDEPSEMIPSIPTLSPSVISQRNITISYYCNTDDEMSNVPNPSGHIEGDPSEIEAFRCIVCKTLPYTTLYQCQYQHIICAGCYQMRVLDKMLGAQLGTCPQCSVRIYRHEPFRNLQGERRLAEVLVACEACGFSLQRAFLRIHCQTDCPLRLVACKYRRIGCKWKGVLGEAAAEHEQECEYRSKRGVQLLEELQQLQAERDSKQCLLSKIMKLLQLPNITVRLLQLLPQVEGFPRNTIKICSFFEAFSQSWSFQLKWQTPDDVEEPADQANCTCGLLFQLCLESPDTCRGALGLTYTLASGTYSEVRFLPNLCEKCDFTRDNVCGPLTLIYKNSWLNCAKLLNDRGFYARLLMARI
ncbi:PREDICTED: cysteine and histidine-rich protein 1-like [Drosophila arizonae]|uniref:Cysteine and histidine-rich protein 1-like n=1 Tax=Drosophila arizonae TaxID=7263 RepID=A0ABM1NPA5_DROAR|nr:PREDICTED: cysteine and histidine-rich protein 1-like [Drosophila arizonae]